MKLVSFAVDGREAFGVVSGDGVVNMTRRLGHATLRAALDCRRLGRNAQGDARREAGS